MSDHTVSKTYEQINEKIARGEAWWSRLKK